MQSEEASDSLKIAAIEQYKLQPGDLLHVRVYSPDPTVNQLFNFESGQARSNYNDISLYLNGFQLDDSSRIELPIIGYIELQNRTFDHAKQIIADSVSRYINDASVNVKLLSYRVTVLGEVRSPGMLTIYRNNSTIFDVLSLVGDIDMLGDREEVMVVRDVKGHKKRFIIDLTQIEAMESPAYHIYPNDIIYIKPLKASIFRDNIPIISLSLSTLTTFLLILNYFR